MITHFFDSLSGPASLTFLGLLVVAFLIGLLPAGLTYAFRVRDMSSQFRKLKAEVQEQEAALKGLRAHWEDEKERADVQTERADTLRTMLEAANTERSELTRKLTAIQEEADQQRELVLEQQQQIQAVKAKLQLANNKVHSLRAAQKPHPKQRKNLHSSAEDLRASLNFSNSKLRQMEERCRRLTEDNEQLRQRMARAR